MDSRSLRLACIVLPILSSACQQDDAGELDVAPTLAPVARLIGGEVVRMTAAGESLFTVHVDAEGAWLQCSRTDGEVDWSTFVTRSRVADPVHLAPIDADETWAAWAEADGVHVWRVGDAERLVFGLAPLPAARVLAVAAGLAGPDVYVTTSRPDGLDDLVRLRFGQDGTLSASEPVSAWFGRVHEIFAHAEGHFAVLGSIGSDATQVLQLFDPERDPSSNTRLSSGPGSVARLVSGSAEGVLVEVIAGSGGHTAQRFGLAGERVRFELPAGTMAVAVAGAGLHTLDVDGVYAELHGEPGEAAVTLAVLDEIAAEEVVPLPGGRVAVRGVRQDVSGVFIYQTR